MGSYNKICPICNHSFITSHKGTECCSPTCGQVKRRQDENVENSKEIKTVWSCGGGVDSTAIAALICSGKLPKPDLAFMVDNGWEKIKTWEHVNSVLIPELARVGVTLHIIPSPKCYPVEKGKVVIPAYIKADKEERKLLPRCGGWKRPVIKKWLREQGIKRCNVWIGMAEDEQRRVRESGLEWYIHQYPLIDAHLTRADCKALIKSMGWPDTPQTSCLFCPQQKDYQWLDMKQNYPTEWQRAIEIEQAIHSVDNNIYLHRSCVDINEVIFKTNQQNQPEGGQNLGQASLF